MKIHKILKDDMKHDEIIVDILRHTIDSHCCFGVYHLRIQDKKL